MPFVTITIRQVTSPDFRKAVSDAIHEGMAAVLGTKPDGRLHVINELEPGFMIHDSVVYGRPRGERFIFVQIHMFPRPTKIKKALVSSMKAHLAELADVADEDVAFLITDAPAESWFTRTS